MKHFVAKKIINIKLNAFKNSVLFFREYYIFNKAHINVFGYSYNSTHGLERYAERVKSENVPPTLYMFAVIVYV